VTKKRGNGQGTVYKRGNTWQAEVNMMCGDIRRRAYKGGFATKREAVAYLPTLAESLRLNRTKTISFTKLFERWTQEQEFIQLSKDKQDAYRIAYKKCASLYALSDVRIATYDTLASIISGMTYYPARDVKRVLNGMWQLAMRMECAEKNPAQLLQLPPIPQARKTTFTDAQIEKLQASSDPFAPVILLMIYMGLRPIEFRMMTVEDVHLDEHYTDGGRKTAREIPIAIPTEAEPILRKMCEQAKTGRLCKLSEDDFYDAFYKCLDATGVQREDNHTLTPVSCRHTFVTRLTRKGVPIAIVQKAARHTSYKTTQGYTHLDITDVLGALNT